MANELLLGKSQIFKKANIKVVVVIYFRQHINNYSVQIYSIHFKYTFTGYY
jgi:hypothetical protein